jgi:hypothetical protein
MWEIYNFLRDNGESKCAVFLDGKLLPDRTEYYFTRSDLQSCEDDKFYSTEYCGEEYPIGRDDDGYEDFGYCVWPKLGRTGGAALRDFINMMTKYECYYEVTDASGAVVFSGEASRSV